MTTPTQQHGIVTVWNQFDTEGSVGGTDGEVIVYSEHVLGDLLALPAIPGGGPDDRLLTLEMINQIPGLLTALAEQLRARWIVPGEFASEADCDRAHELTDTELVEQWVIAFRSLGEDGLPFEVELTDFDYLHGVLEEKLQAKFPGLVWGIGDPLPESLVQIPRADLTEGIDAEAAHERLVAAVPAWGEFLDWIAPTRLFQTEGWSAAEVSGVPA